MFPSGFEQDEWLTQGVILRRIFAWWLDIALLGALAGLLWSSIVALGFLTFGLGYAFLPILPLVPFLYHFLFLASPLSASPGQAVCGLTVRRNDTLGRPTPLQALIFTICFYITLAAGVVWLAVALFTDRRRTLHDLVSGLVVVRIRALTPAVGTWTMAGGPPYA